MRIIQVACLNNANSRLALVESRDVSGQVIPVPTLVIRELLAG